jgi:hypothetical protein
MPDLSGCHDPFTLEFSDPSKLTGSSEERIAGTRKIRDQINDQVETWCAEVCFPEGVS